MAVQISGNDITVPRDGSFTRNVTIGGTLTYEDVTNIDSVGLVTARNGIEIGARPGVAASISVDGNMIVSGISTVGELISSYGTFVRNVNDNGLTIAGGNASNSGANVTVYGGSHGSYPDTVRFRIDGSEKARIDSSGRLLKSGQAALTSTSLNHPIQVAAASDATAIAIIGRAADDISELNFYEADKSTNLGEIQYRQDHANIRHRVGYLAFATGGVTERLRITSTGEVGIGIDTPTKTGIQNNVKVLQIDGGDGAELILGNSTSQNVSTNHIGAIAFKNIDTSTGNAPHYAGIRCNCVDTSGNMNLRFYTGTTRFEADSPDMMINANGNVGIVENSPDALLHLSTGASATCELRLQANNTGSGAGDRGRINVYSSRNDGTEYQAGYVDIDRSSGTEDKAHLLVALNNGSGVGERLRITSGGSLLIGATSTNYDELLTILESGTDNEIATWRVSNGSHNKDMVNMIHVANSGSRVMIRFRRTGSLTSIGDITTSATTTSYGTNSDYRLKENEALISDGITRLKALKPYRFNFKAEPDKTVDGFFAHEVQAVVPEAVTGEKDAVQTTHYTSGDTIPDGKVVGDVKEENALDPQGLDYAKLTPLLTAALQEAVTEIESLKARLDAAGL